MRLDGASRYVQRPPKTPLIQKLISGAQFLEHIEAQRQAYDVIVPNKFFNLVLNACSESVGGISHGCRFLQIKANEQIAILSAIAT